MVISTTGSALPSRRCYLAQCVWCFGWRASSAPSDRQAKTRYNVFSFSSHFNFFGYALFSSLLRTGLLLSTTLVFLNLVATVPSLPGVAANDRKHLSNYPFIGTVFWWALKCGCEYAYERQYGAPLLQRDSMPYPLHAGVFWTQPEWADAVVLAGQSADATALDMSMAAAVKVFRSSFSSLVFATVLHYLTLLQIVNSTALQTTGRGVVGAASSARTARAPAPARARAVPTHQPGCWCSSSMNRTYLHAAAVLLLGACAIKCLLFLPRVVMRRTRFRQSGVLTPFTPPLHSCIPRYLSVRVERTLSTRCIPRDRCADMRSALSCLIRSIDSIRSCIRAGDSPRIPSTSRLG